MRHFISKVKLALRLVRSQFAISRGQQDQASAAITAVVVIIILIVFVVAASHVGLTAGEIWSAFKNFFTGPGFILAGP